MTEGRISENLNKTTDETLLEDIRQDYSYFRDYWQENYKEAKTDLAFVAGDPWDPTTRRERESLDRPVVSPDELGQYLNSTINNLRQSPRSIKVTPSGDGSDDKTAQMRSSLIKGIEYKSNAQAAYTNAFESAINCGFGFFRVSTRRTGVGSEVEPCIRVIENPLSVLMDPNAKEADFSDMKRCFILDVMRQRDFGRAYPKAKKRDFTEADGLTAPGWVTQQNVLVAEYWRIDDYDPETGDGGKVKQYITNGLEILDTREWPGSKIPIISVLGKKIYVPQGDAMLRMFYSMVRLARPCQKMLAYIASQEAEEYGMAPRAPIMGYVGQFETDSDAWQTLNKVPRSYVQIDPQVDGASGQTLPLPTRLPFAPNYAAYEAGYERWRRSLQAAMGITALPTSAQRQNEKSGVALERIQTQQAVGSFHFTDNFDRSLENAGRQIDELITKTMDTERQVAVRNPDETHTVMHVVPGGAVPEGAEPGTQVLDPAKGNHDVTISTGPSYQSQRDQQDQFVDTLVQNIANLPQAGSPPAKILALGIKMKAIGPLADEIAKILSPEEDGQQLPPEVMAQMQQMKQAHDALNAACQELEKEKQGKVWETQGKLAIVQAQHAADMDLEKLKLENSLTIAEVNTKAQDARERAQTFDDMQAQFHEQSHDIAMQKDQQAHAQDLAAQQAQQQSQQSAQDAAQGQDAAAQQAEQQQQAQAQQPDQSSGE